MTQLSEGVIRTPDAIVLYEDGTPNPNPITGKPGTHADYLRQAVETLQDAESIVYHTALYGASYIDLLRHEVALGTVFADEDTAKFLNLWEAGKEAEALLVGV